MQVRTFVSSVRLLAHFLILLSVAISQSTAQQSTSITGQTQRIEPPHVSEPWSFTASAPSSGNAVAPQRESEEEDARDIPGFAEAKAAANARKLASMLAQPTANAVPAGAAAVNIVANTFVGPSNGVFSPPDLQIAAGPSNLVTAINNQLDIYNKSGVHLSTTQFATFFSSVVQGGNLTDPRVIYDQRSGRFILTVSQRLDNGPNAQSAHILLAVSQTSDPTGVWNKYALDWLGRSLDNRDNTWPDFPTLGVSSSAIYIASDQVPFFAGVPDEWITVIGLPELLSGSGSLNLTRFTDVKTPAGDVTNFVQPALTYGALNSEYLISSDANPNLAGAHGQLGHALHLFKINTSGTPTLTAVDVPVATYAIGPNAAQPGSTALISTGGPNIADGAVVINGSLWCTHNVLDSTGTNTVIRWYQIDPVGATVQQTGVISGAGEAYYGAIAVSNSSEVSLVYTTSSTVQPASSGYARRTAADPSGTMSVTGVYHSGNGATTATRWGDYSGISLDTDGSTVWGLGEFENSGEHTEIVRLITSGSTPPPSCTASASSVNICTPVAGSTVASSVAISAAANGGTLAITAMKAYLDGAQVASSSTGTLNGSVSAAAGSHTLTVNAWNKAGTLFQKKITFSVSTGACAKPASAGLNVCSPAAGATVTSPVAISAAANGGTRAVTAMKAYVDGAQVAAGNTGTLNASVAAAAGTHTLQVNAWNSAGTVFTSKRTFSVK